MSEIRLQAKPRRAGIETRTINGVKGAFVVENVLSRADCAALIELTESLGYGPKVSRRPGPPIRTNERVLYIAPAELRARLEGVLRPILDLHDRHWAGPGWRLADNFLNPRWRMNRYLPGQVFHPHFDSGHRFAPHARTLLSFILYLNDDFAGGDTVFFPDGHSGDHMLYCDRTEVRVRPQTGSALVFPHFGADNPRHAGAPITSGCKYILRTDILFEHDPISFKDAVFGSPDHRDAVILLGRQGAGKSVQAERLAAAMGFTALHFGAHVRAQRTAGTDLGRRLSEWRETRRTWQEARYGPATDAANNRLPGGYLADDLAIEVVTDALRDTPAESGVVFDGFPRTLSQSGWLEAHPWHTLAVVELAVDADDAARRLAKRGREGDDAASQRARHIDHERHVEPLIAHYNKRGQVVRIDGAGSHDQVTARLVAAVETRKLQQLASYFPDALQTLLAGCESDGRDCSSNPRTRVFDYGPYFLKIAPDLGREALALGESWQPLASPQVLGFFTVGKLDLLLTRRLAGTSMKAVAATATEADKPYLCAELARVLRALHDRPVSGAGSQEATDHHALAAQRLAAGRVSLSNFRQKYGVHEPVESHAQLRARFARLQPPEPDPVRLHGDPCLPNFMMEAGRITATLDLGAATVGDRGIDLALASWSIGHNLGPDWPLVLLAEYGLDSWPERAYYEELVRFLR